MERSGVKWQSDPSHSELLFKVKHLMITNVKGEFRKFTAVVEGEDIERSKARVVIDASSIFTNDDDRDKHLKSADFFDVENHREIIFESRGIKKTGNAKYEVSGSLTIKGISREIVLDVEYGGANKDPWGNEKAGFAISGVINRKDWGLNWNAALETGGFLVGDEVKLEGEVQFIKVGQG